jgi:hypothetical protein
MPPEPSHYMILFPAHPWAIVLYITNYSTSLSLILLFAALGNNGWNEGWSNDGFDFDDGLNQDVEQEAESGDVDQSFDVSGTGDNSNQTVGTQGVANTGNAQNATGIIQVGGDADDFEFDDVGSSIEVSPSSTTDSDQRVNQSASD